MTTDLTQSKLSQGGKENKPESTAAVGDHFGRTGKVQVLHVDLYYADGTKGEINVTAPAIVWGEDIELQWYALRTYIKDQYQRLGIVKYRAHCYHSLNGEIEKTFSWFAFDLITNIEIFE